MHWRGAIPAQARPVFARRGAAQPGKYGVKAADRPGPLLRRCRGFGGELPQPGLHFQQHHPAQLLIATPDHTHAVIAMAAMQAGKHVFCQKPLSDRPKEGMPVPADLDWDLWLGPAAERPYHSGYHPMVWRCWWDFGCGMMGDRGAHTLDSVKSALKLGAPTSIEG